MKKKYSYIVKSLVLFFGTLMQLMHHCDGNALIIFPEDLAAWQEFYNASNMREANHCYEQKSFLDPCHHCNKKFHRHQYISCIKDPEHVYHYIEKISLPKSNLTGELSSETIKKFNRLKKLDISGNDELSSSDTQMGCFDRASFCPTDADCFLSNLCGDSITNPPTTTSPTATTTSPTSSTKTNLPTTKPTTKPTDSTGKPTAHPSSTSPTPVLNTPTAHPSSFKSETPTISPTVIPSIPKFSSSHSKNNQTLQMVLGIFVIVFLAIISCCSIYKFLSSVARDRKTKNQDHVRIGEFPDKILVNQDIGDHSIDDLAIKDDFEPSSDKFLPEKWNWKSRQVTLKGQDREYGKLKQNESSRQGVKSLAMQCALVLERS